MNQLIRISFYLVLFGVLFACSKDDDGPTFSCNDGMQNGTETGVDCGGDCPPCISCFDNIQNGDEMGVDCGGSCAPCVTCNDNIQNGDETGVDCGGALCPVCPTCDDGEMNGDETGIDCGGSNCQQCYSIGLVGPGGGAVFYDKENYDDDWRYMEAIIVSQLTNWGCIERFLGTSADVASGPSNTNLLRSASPTCNEPSRLSQACADANLAVFGGQSDWFVPSLDEARELWPIRNVLPFGNGVYWTSSEFNTQDVFVVNLAAATQSAMAFTWFKEPVNGNQGKAEVILVRRF